MLTDNLRKLHWPIAMMPNMSAPEVAPRGINRALNQRQRRQLYPKANYRQLFYSRPLRWAVARRSDLTWRRPFYDRVLLHVRAYGDSPVSSAMTHMRWQQGRRGRESTDFTTVWSSVSVRCEPGPIDRCSNKDAGRSERETPTLCEQRAGQDKTITHAQITP